MAGTNPDNAPGQGLKRIGRREFLTQLGKTSIAAALLLVGCKSKAPTEPVFVTPEAAEQITKEEALRTLGLTEEQYAQLQALTLGSQATATSDETKNTATEWEIRIDLDRLHPNWPRTHEEAAALLADDSHPIRPEQLVRIIDPDGIWRGWWMGETFPLKTGISYNSTRGHHIDTNGNPVFDPLRIFDTTQAPRPEDLANIRVNTDFIAVFGRRGGVTRGGLPQHTHYFTGEERTEIKAIEQLSIIPVAKEVCVDWDLGSNTVAWRQAVKEFRDNPHARDGFVENGTRRFVNVVWFNTQTGQWQQLDGRMIAELAREHYDLSGIDRWPAGWPISNEMVARVIGGQPEHWVFDPSTGEWFNDAWPLKPGVRFVSGVGHFSSDGKLLVGAKQTDAATTQIFDFSQPPVNMANRMNGPGYLPAVLFVRVGRMTNNPNLRDRSWYSWGNGNVQISEAAIEQATLMPTSNPCVPTTRESTDQLERARQLASEQPDPNVIALYWNGGAFVSVR